MTMDETLRFEIYVMELAEECKTAKDYMRLSEELHESVENAIQDMVHDEGIEGYIPSF